MKQYSLKTRMMSVVALVITFTFLSGSFAVIYQSYCIDLKTLENSGRFVANIQADAVAVPMWDINNEKVEKILGSLFQDSSFLGAVVTDVFGETIASLGKVEENEDSLTFNHEIIHRDSGGQESLGNLKILYSKKVINENAIDHIYLTTGTLLLLLIVITATVLGVVQHIIITPLNSFILAISAMVGNDGKRQLDIPKQKELAQLAYVFNEMTSDIAQHYNDLSEKTHRLQVAVEALEVSRSQAETANKAKSQFLANMSHELRTPLNAIIGYSEIILDDIEDLEPDEMVPDLEKIISSAKHLLSLISDILDISKIEAGKMEVYLEEFDINELATQVVTLSKPMVDSSKSILDVNVDPCLGTMRSDYTKVKQMIINLLSNAAKFTIEGTVTFSVALYENQNSEWIKFSVRDTGIGMSEEVLSRIFHAFIQADSSTTKKFGGTGLGLTITKEFSQLLGGDLTVTSVEGEGSEFTLELPISYVQESQQM